MEGGGFAAARPSIVRKEIGGALAWNRGLLPFKIQDNVADFKIKQGSSKKA